VTTRARTRQRPAPGEPAGRPRGGQVRPGGGPLSPRNGAGPSDYASRVLDLAESIPAGRVLTYGDIAEYLGRGGPRQVGRVLALWGGGVPWWRVIHADGRLLPGHEREALEHYRAEGTPLRSGPEGTRPRVDLAAARWSGR
jgi:alkylated DNA nucleotide flippase Atl1